MLYDALTDAAEIVLLRVDSLRVLLVQRVDHLVNVLNRRGHLNAVARLQNLDVLLVRKRRRPLPMLKLFDNVLTLYLIELLLKDVVELALEILLHHCLRRLLPAHLVLNIVLVFLYSHALPQRQIGQLAHPVVELLPQKVVLPLVRQSVVQLQVVIVAIAAHVR